MGGPAAGDQGGQGICRPGGASLLKAMDLAELVSETAEAYERLALDLATAPDRLAEIRAGFRPTGPPNPCSTARP